MPAAPRRFIGRRVYELWVETMRSCSPTAALARPATGKAARQDEAHRLHPRQRLALAALRQTPAMGVLLALHPGVVFALFPTMPYGRGLWSAERRR